MSNHLNRQLENARKRLAYARQQREAFALTMDSTEAERHTLAKLEDDERQAERDISWLMHALMQGDKSNGSGQHNRRIARGILLSVPGARRIMARGRCNEVLGGLPSHVRRVDVLGGDVAQVKGTHCQRSVSNFNPSLCRSDS